MSAGAFEGELTTAEARMLRAELLGDEAGWRALRQLHLGEEQGRRYVTSVVFAMAVVARFSGVADLREVTCFVSRFNAAVPQEEQVPPREAESMLRTVLGELHLQDVVEIDELLSAAESSVLDAVQKGELEPFPADLGDAPLVGRDRPYRRPGMRQAAGTAVVGPDDVTTKGS